MSDTFPAELTEPQPTAAENPSAKADSAGSASPADLGIAPSGEPCENCGAPVEPDDHFCTACGATLQPPAPPTAELVQRYFQCKNCGAQTATDPEQRSFTCPFCDSTYVLEYSPDVSGRQAPEFVIPFSVTNEQALEKYRRWIGENRWYRPSDLHAAKIEEKLKGIYLPFWSFAMLAESEWSASIGEHWYRTETYTTMENGKMVTRTRQVQETEWWPLAGRHHKYYSGYLVSGSRGLSQQDADRVKPFLLAGLHRYQPYFLAGWLCEEYSIDREAAMEISRAAFGQWIERDVKGFLPGDTHRRLVLRSRFSKESSDLILLPIYLLTYRYGQKTYRFLINGQTGRVAGDKPISTGRIAAAIGIGLAVLAAIVIGAMVLSAL